MRRLATVQGWDSDDEPAQLLERLRGFTPDVLREILPWAGCAQAQVASVLAQHKF